MPRRRQDVLKGFSGRFVSDLDRLERTRNYLCPGKVKDALDGWATYVRYPYRRLWTDRAPTGCPCCDTDPAGDRELLGFVARALPHKSARELRKRLEELDALY